jgi:hypothetical protein
VPARQWWSPVSYQSAQQLRAKSVPITDGASNSGNERKISGLGGAYPILKNVYYIQTSTDPQTKAVSDVLIRHGNEFQDRSLRSSPRGTLS